MRFRYITEINNYFFFDRLLQLLMQINLLLVLEETVSHLSRDSTSKNIKNWKSEIIPLAADNCDKDVAMFAAYKIYIIVNISEDDGDYFVIFKSAVEWSKEWSVWKQFRVAKCYLCYVSTKRSNQSVFSRIRERGSESDSKYVCSNPPHENTYRCLPVNS